ncbi:MAG: hypothetical protein ACT4QB_02790 [Gammaproteobacteria bacterium]
MTIYSNYDETSRMKCKRDTDGRKFSHATSRANSVLITVEPQSNAHDTRSPRTGYSQTGSTVDAGRLGIESHSVPTRRADTGADKVGHAARAAKRARDSAIEFTNAGERFVRVGHQPENLKVTLEHQGGRSQEHMRFLQQPSEKLETIQ